MKRELKWIAVLIWVLLVTAFLLFVWVDPVSAGAPPTTDMLLAESKVRIETLLAQVRVGGAEAEIVVSPLYYDTPVILRPAPDNTYGSRTRVHYQVRSQYRDQWDPMAGQLEYRWWTESHTIPAGGEFFEWTWNRELAANEYFQVQLICPSGEHRGIHSPTKDSFTAQGGGLRYIVQDCKGAQTRAWDYESWKPIRDIDLQWTVAVVKWDGIDPSLIGVALAEAAAQWIRI